MKAIFSFVLCLTLLSSFASDLDKPELVKNDKIVSCSVTSSGTATTSDGTVISLTLTVTGNCDSSLAQDMRDAIAAARAEIAQM